MNSNPSHAERQAAKPANLPALAKQINDHHLKCERSIQTGLRHALKAGRLLIEAKGRCPHGKWIDWIKERFCGSLRNAQGYMRLADRWPEIEGKSQRVAHLSYREAMRLLASPSAPKQDETLPRPEPATQPPKTAAQPQAKQDKALVGGKEAVKAAVMPDWAKGPTPQEQAKNDPGVRWSASMHKLYVFMNSTRDHGGILKLVCKWVENTKAGYVVELRRIRGALQKWIDLLADGEDAEQ